MLEIKCPKCGEVIELDKSSYDALLNEVEKEELDKRVKAQVAQVEQTYKAKLELEQNKSNASKEKEIGELKAELSLLQEKLKGSNKDTELAVSKALETYKEELSKKNQEITKLQADIKENEISLKEKYDFLLKAKDEEIQRYKDFRMGDSTKDLGESLEQYCKDAFDEIRAYAYPRAYFEKDNESVDGTKGDFVFKDYSEDGIELCSIMFEMKNQKDDTEHKHKNSDFFKKLDSDRNKKGCEYAVLVSTLEEDSKLYNNGIVDVSHIYPKMFVVRPQFFLPIIGLIKTMSGSAYQYKKAVAEYKQQNVDISKFEEAVQAIAGKIQADYEKAGNIYAEVDKMCDDIVKKVETFRKEFHTATGWIEKAKNQLPNLEIRKLTHGNPTMKEKFDELNEKK